jgi:hypothetical protein
MTNKAISALTAATTPLAGTEVVPLVQGGATVNVAAKEVAATLVKTNASFGVAVALSTWSLGIVEEIGASGNFLFTNGTGNMSVGTGAYYNAGWKYVGNGYASRYQQTAGRHSWQSATLNASGPGTAAAMTERMALDTTFNLHLVSGNFVPDTSGKGIDFSAVIPAAGMTSQLLNWYEEGTWTGVMGGLTSESGQTYSNSTCSYTRVGRFVTLTGYIRCTVPGTITGSAVIKGLPFPCRTGGNQFDVSCSILAFSGMGINTTSMYGYLTTGESQIRVHYYVSAASGSTAASNLLWQSGTNPDIAFSLTYCTN